MGTDALPSAHLESSSRGDSVQLVVSSKHLGLVKLAECVDSRLRVDL